MPTGTNWYSWFSIPFFAPLSGAVTQDIHTEPYAGSIEIERAVIRDEASFGRQLGWLTEAVLDLVHHLESQQSPHTFVARSSGPSKTSAVDELKTLSERIETIKTTHRQSAEREAERAIERLKAVDPKGITAFLDRFRN